MNHPCQILCDLQTIKEKFGNLKGLTLAYVGDSENNVTYSLMHGCAHVGINVRVGCPDDPEHKPKQEIVEEAKAVAKAYADKNGTEPTTIEVFHNAAEAVKDADVVYTDSWMSYHIPVDRMEIRKQKLMPFQVTTELMGNAKSTAVFMNCLPAMRGLEQTAEVVDGPQSIVFDQAENRLHAQKALMLKLLGKI